MKFELSKEDTKDIVFTEEEREEYELSKHTLKNIKKIAAAKFNCIRGDVILIKEIEGINDFGTVIFDGENMINMDFSLDNACPPEKFQSLVEFPIAYWNFLYLGAFYFKRSINIDTEDIMTNYVSFWLFLYVPFIVNDTVYYAVYNPDRLYGVDIKHIDKQKIVKVFNTTTYVWINREYSLPMPLTNDNTVTFEDDEDEIWID